MIGEMPRETSFLSSLKACNVNSNVSLSQNTHLIPEGKIYRVEQQTKTELNVFRYSRARWDFCGHFPLKCSQSRLPFKLSRICQGPGQASLWNFLS